MNMNMSMSNRHAKRAICKAILAIYCVSHQPLLRATSIHSEPLATGATSVSPNLMFILDDSGSMSFEYTPDYVDDSLCRDAWEDVRLGTSTYALTTTTGLDSKDDNSALDLCRRGDPTWTSPNFNFQYYNPARSLPRP